MSSETTMTAKQYRFQKWAAEIMDFQSRLAGMNVVNWCACHGITKTNYYYRLRRAREAEGTAPQQIVPVDPKFLLANAGNGT